MMLRWEQDADGGWRGLSGRLRVADVWALNGRWCWQVGLHGTARPESEETPEAARAAAEATWGKWCRAAVLVPVVWRTMDTAPKDGTRILAHCDDGTQAVMRFEPTAYTRPVWVCDAYEPASQIPEAWMPLPLPPPETHGHSRGMPDASGLLSPYKGDGGEDRS